MEEYALVGIFEAHIKALNLPLKFSIANSKNISLAGKLKSYLISASQKLKETM